MSDAKVIIYFCLSPNVIVGGYTAPCRSAVGCLYLIVQSCYFLLTGSRKQKRVHLGLQCVINLHVNVIACSLLLVIRIHTKRNCIQQEVVRIVTWTNETKNFKTYTTEGCWVAMKLPDDMVDDDGLWGHQECMQALWDFRELHPLSLKDLKVKQIVVKYVFLFFFGMCLILLVIMYMCFLCPAVTLKGGLTMSQFI